MKITIHKEKYINNPCPPMTKDMWDWFYENLWVRFMKTDYFNSDHFQAYEKENKIETMHVRINQAYEGCNTIHFYVSIDGQPEFHMEYFLLTNFRKWYDSQYGRTYYRYDWIHDFYNIGDVTMDAQKTIDRYKHRWWVKRMKKDSAKRVKGLKAEWNKYLKLKEKFSVV